MRAPDNDFVSMVRAELAAHPEMAPDPIRDTHHGARESGLAKGAVVKRVDAWPYHLAGYVASVELGMGPADAARLIGRDRKTLWWGVPRVEERRDDPEFDAFVEHLAEMARERIAA